MCANADRVVAEYKGSCVATFNKKGEKIRSTKRTTLREFNRLRAATMSNDGHILVTDHHGYGLLEFDWPIGIAVHLTTGKIFIADQGNDRIQVFNGADLSFSHTIRHRKITRPLNIAVDSEGYLYITGYGTDKVHKFTTTGQYIHTVAIINNSTIKYLAIHIHY